MKKNEDISDDFEKMMDKFSQVSPLTKALDVLKNSGGGIRAAEAYFNKPSKDFSDQEKELAVMLHLYDQNTKDGPKAPYDEVDKKDIKPKVAEEVKGELAQIVKRLAAPEIAEKGFSFIELSHYVVEQAEDKPENKGYVAGVIIYKRFDDMIISSLMPTKKLWQENPKAAEEMMKKYGGQYVIKIVGIMDEALKMLFSDHTSSSYNYYHNTAGKFKLEEAVKIVEDFSKNSFSDLKNDEGFKKYFVGKLE